MNINSAPAQGNAEGKRVISVERHPAGAEARL